MDIQITDEFLKAAQQKYCDNDQNRIIENAVTRNGIDNVCYNRKAAIEARDNFNIDLGCAGISDQKSSLRCWAFAGLNMFKKDIADELNINPADFELSQNYLIFYDKLEKANNAYENTILLKDLPPNDRMIEHIYLSPIPEGGHWKMFTELVNKYGVAPKAAMPETIDSAESNRICQLLRQKMRKDILTLRSILQNGASPEDARNEKAKMLQEIYVILCKAYGTPPTEFDYEYIDKDGKYQKISRITPADFKARYFKKDLNDYVSVGNVPMFNKSFNKVYQVKYFGNIHKTSNMDFLNLELNEFKELAVRQLKDGEPIWLACHINHMQDKKEGILSADLYDYETVLGIPKMSKEESLNSYNTCLQHCMVFRGANLCDGKPNRWKVEDSFGAETHKKGFYIMDDKFFDDYVLQLIINKKHLSESQLELSKQEPVLFECWEPMG